MKISILAIVCVLRGVYYKVDILATMAIIATIAILALLPRPGVWLPGLFAPVNGAHLVTQLKKLGALVSLCHTKGCFDDLAITHPSVV